MPFNDVFETFGVQIMDLSSVWIQLVSLECLLQFFPHALLPRPTPTHDIPDLRFYGCSIARVHSNIICYIFTGIMAVRMNVVAKFFVEGRCSLEPISRQKARWQGTSIDVQGNWNV
jgi:hypothetical protein